MLAHGWALMGLGRKMAREPTLSVPAATWRGLAGALSLSPKQQSALRQLAAAAALAAYRQDVHRHKTPGSTPAAIAPAWVAREGRGTGRALDTLLSF